MASEPATLVDERLEVAPGDAVSLYCSLDTVPVSESAHEGEECLGGTHEAVVFFEGVVENELRIQVYGPTITDTTTKVASLHIRA